MRTEELLCQISEVMHGPNDGELSRLFRTAEQVERLLRENVQGDIQCFYQGSVLNNTVVLDYSDVDLLVISREYCLCDTGYVRWVMEHSEDDERLKLSVRLGNIPIVDITESIARTSCLRKECAYVLKSAYTNVKINQPKALAIIDNATGVKFDVVIATFIETMESILDSTDLSLKGVCVYNAKTGKYDSIDFPLLNASAINLQDEISGGRFRRLVRFLKKIKGELSSGMTSFDVYSVCKAISPEIYSNDSDAQLVFHLYEFYRRILNSKETMESVRDFTGREYLFRNNEKRVNEAIEIYNALNAICSRLLNDSLKCTYVEDDI